jgi:predicted TIM-barrel fold metal-dependent hydrolase
VAGGWFYEAAPGIGRPIAAEAVDLDLHLADMDAHGVDAIVCSAAGLAGIGDVTMLEPAEATGIARLVNAEIAAAQRAHDKRFIGLCVLPL